MDPLSITAGVFGMLQAVASCLKLLKKHIGPSSMSSEETENLRKSLYNFHAATSNLQIHLNIHDDDDEQMASLGHLNDAIRHAFESLQIVREYLGGKKTERVFRGVKFDKRLKQSMKALDDASKLFTLAIMAEQQTIMLGVKTYVEEIREGLSDVQNVQSDSEQDMSYRDITAWLNAQSDTDMNSQIQETNTLTRHPGTCEWLLSHDLFLNWIDTSPNSIDSNLWLKGSPGSGKSFLCSTAIEHVSKNLHQLCLYHYYRFDDQHESTPEQNRVRVAALLVLQLFRYFWQQDRRLAKPVSEYIKVVDKTPESLAEVSRLIITHGHQCAQEKRTTSDIQPITLFVFLDGIDESKGDHIVDDILNLFSSLQDDMPVIQKTWISSRETDALLKEVGKWPYISENDRPESDVDGFLIEAVANLEIDLTMEDEVEGKPLKGWILSKLQARAKGNFLCAKLMVDWLKDEAFSHDDIVSQMPTGISDMYKRIFLQYKPSQLKYVSLLFSFVAFARRPLRLYELREAIALALSSPANQFDHQKAPINLQKLFSPLIEIQRNPGEPDNPFCRLCHSTVQEYLTQNPDVLQDNNLSPNLSANTISPSRWGELCLRYLSLQRYSTLKETNFDTCQDSPLPFDDDTQQDHLLSYCAKFWARHLDDIKPPTLILRKTLRDFLSSPNFQTLLQAQSMFVVGQFIPFRRARRTFRAFPTWFGEDASCNDYHEEELTSRRDYLHFVAEWGYLLHRSTCTACSGERFWGQIDRCMTGLLGPTNFMKDMREKYPSFMLTTKPFTYYGANQTIMAEAVSPSDFQLMVVSSSAEDLSEISFDVWDLRHPSTPQVLSTKMIPEEVISKFRAIESIAFSQNAASFVLEDRVLDECGWDSPVVLDNQNRVASLSPLSTDFDRRGNVFVVASRNLRQRPWKRNSFHVGFTQQSERLNSKVTNIDNIGTTNFKNKVENPSALDNPDNKCGDDGEIESSGDESKDIMDDTPSSSSDDENSAYETFSEGSTEFESRSETSEDEREMSDSTDSSDDDSESDLESDTSASETRLGKPRRHTPVLDPRQPANGKLSFEAGLSAQKGEERPTYPGLPGRFRSRQDRITATVAVYVEDSGQTLRVFHYENDIPAMLYQSPPVLHPHKPFLVWPLAGGEILFADYEEKTYFVRAVMPTTRNTRHICMKAHFSPCGSFLHIASVEGRVARGKVAPATSFCTDSAMKQNMVLSLFLTTYRLSSRKTTRSPPWLIHKVKLTLGHFTGVSLARLPFTFSWTREHLYFTVSGTRLNTFRVGLFRPSSSSQALITVPRLSVMLPLSATQRQVHYLPPTLQDDGPAPKRSVVLLGSLGAANVRVQLEHYSLHAQRRGMGDLLTANLNDHTSPAMCLFLDEEKDLGGWIPFVTERECTSEEEGVTRAAGLEERFRNGKLTRRLETLNWEDDVDLEGLCDFCNRPLFFTSPIIRG